MAMTSSRRVFWIKWLSSVSLMALLVLGAYRVADSCGGGWSPHFFIPYSPGEKNLLAQMTAIKMDEQYEPHDDKDDSYLRIYEETYAQDFNPVISRDIRQSYEWLAQGNIKAALSKDRALLTRLRNYVPLNHTRSKKLVVFLNTTEERVLLIQQGLPLALTQSLAVLLQKIDEEPYEEAQQKIMSLGATLPKNQQFYTRWYGFLLKRLYGKPINEADYPDPTAAPKMYRDRVAYAVAKADTQKNYGRRLPVLRALAASVSDYKQDARLALAQYYFRNDRVAKALETIRPLVDGKARPSFRAQALLVDWVLESKTAFPNAPVAEFIKNMNGFSYRYRKEREAQRWGKPQIAEASIYSAAGRLTRSLGERERYWRPIIQYYRGVGAYIYGNYPDAAEIFTGLIREYPIHYFTPRAYYYLFYCYHHLYNQKWKADPQSEFDKHLLAFSKTYPDHSLLDDSINLYLHTYAGHRPPPEVLQRFFAGWNEADNLTEIIKKLYAEVETLSAVDLSTLKNSLCYDRYLYISRQWLALLSEFPGSRFAPMAYLKYSHHAPDNVRTDVLLKYSDYVKKNADRLDPELVKAATEDYPRARFLASQYDVLKKIVPAAGIEFWYSALASLQTGDTERAVALMKRLAAIENDPYYKEQARGFLTAHYFETEPLTSLHYFTQFLESADPPPYDPTTRSYYFKYTGDYDTYALGDYQETYLSEKDIESFIQRHPGLKSTESMRSSLATRYLRQFKFEDAQRLAAPLPDENLHQKIKDVKAHYAVDRDAGLYATGAWFYHGDAAIFSSPTTSYKYEKAKSLNELQTGYLGQLNKYLIARKMFAALIQKYPDSPLIDKAHYSLALCDIYVWSHNSFYYAFKKELWNDAVKNFLAVYRKTPKSPLADDALYWAGYFSEVESEKQKYWDLIRKEYPDGDVMRRGIPRPEHKQK